MITNLMWGVGGFLFGIVSKFAWDLLYLISVLDEEAEERLE